MMSSDHPPCYPLILTSLLFSFIFAAVSGFCPSTCGGIEIPYPFGIGKGCYLNKWYEITCNTSISGKPDVPFLSLLNREVVNISLPSQFLLYDSNSMTHGSVRIINPITSKGCSSSDEDEPRSLLNLTGTPFYVAASNTLVAIGCNNKASLTNVKPSMVGCISSCLAANRTTSKDYLAVFNCNSKSRHYYDSYEYCSERSFKNETACTSGSGCCKANMPDSLQQVVGVTIDDDANATTTGAGGCKVAFLTDDPNLLHNKRYRYHPKLMFAEVPYVSVELGWFIYPTNPSFVDSLRCTNTTEYLKMYRVGSSSDRKTLQISCVCDYTSHFSNYASCRCNDGYTGNPYIPGECKG